RWSSEAITEAASHGEISSSGRQSCSRRTVSPFRYWSHKRRIMRGVTGGGTTRYNKTAAVVETTKKRMARKAQRRTRRSRCPAGDVRFRNASDCGGGFSMRNGPKVNPQRLI